jgi:hypothetical protein
MPVGLRHALSICFADRLIRQTDRIDPAHGQFLLDVFQFGDRLGGMAAVVLWSGPGVEVDGVAWQAILRIRAGL